MGMGYSWQQSRNDGIFLGLNTVNLLCDLSLLEVQLSTERGGHQLDCLIQKAAVKNIFMRQSRLGSDGATRSWFQHALNFVLQEIDLEPKP